MKHVSVFEYLLLNHAKTTKLILMKFGTHTVNNRLKQFISEQMVPLGERGGNPGA